MLTQRVDENLVSLIAPETFAAEQYLGLRLKLERLRQARNVSVIAVTSPGTGDGKTLTSINIAGALGRGAADRILLIDADLRSPSVDTSLALDGRGAPGLADAIMNPAVTFDDIVRRPEHLPFAVIPAGSATVPAHEILRSTRLDQLLSDAKQRFDYVLLDTPPLAPVFDAALLSRSVDGVLVVVAAHKTPRRQLEEALNLLDPAKVLGIVFNNDTRPAFGRYDSYYRRRFTSRFTAGRSEARASQ